MKNIHFYKIFSILTFFVYTLLKIQSERCESGLISTLGKRVV